MTVSHRGDAYLLIPAGLVALPVVGLQLVVALDTSPGWGAVANAAMAFAVLAPAGAVGFVWLVIAAFLRGGSSKDTVGVVLSIAALTLLLLTTGGTMGGAILAAAWSLQWFVVLLALSVLSLVTLVSLAIHLMRKTLRVELTSGSS